jgi:hypothetical protein
MSRTDELMKELMAELRAEMVAENPGVGEPGDAVIGNLVLLTLNKQLEPGVMAHAFMRSVAATSRGVSRNLVRTELLRLFDQAWADFAPEHRRRSAH